MTSTEALSRLAAAGRIRSAWLRGMLYCDSREAVAYAADPTFSPPVMYRWAGPQFEGHTPGPFAEPVADDPATTGCLLALLREASGFPLAYVAPTRHGEGWCVTWEPLHPIDHIVHPTEHAAIVAALVAVAESL